VHSTLRAKTEPLCELALARIRRSHPVDDDWNMRIGLQQSSAFQRLSLALQTHLFRLPVHNQEGDWTIERFAICPSGNQQIATVESNYENRIRRFCIQVWDVATKICKLSFPIPIHNGSWATCCEVWFPVEGLIIFQRFDVITVWDANTGELVRSHAFDFGPRVRNVLRAGGVAAHGTIVFASDGSTLQLFDAQDGRVETNLIDFTSELAEEVGDMDMGGRVSPYFEMVVCRGQFLLVSVGLTPPNRHFGPGHLSLFDLADFSRKDSLSGHYHGLMQATDDDSTIYARCALQPCVPTRFAFAVADGRIMRRAGGTGHFMGAYQSRIYSYNMYLEQIWTYDENGRRREQTLHQPNYPSFFAPPLGMARNELYVLDDSGVNAFCLQEPPFHLVATI